MGKCEGIQMQKLINNAVIEKYGRNEKQNLQ